MRQIILSAKDIERFWVKVDKHGPVPAHAPELGPCWLWVATRKKSQHGTFYLASGGMIPAHRVSWVIANGRDPGEWLVRHRCDNPPCVNPKHLLTGTHKDNAADMYERGRQTTSNRGEGSHFAKLTEGDVRKIRAALANGERYGDLARQFGVGKSAIGEIARRRNWAYVEDGLGAIMAGAPRGEANSQTKLTEGDVIRIRELAANGATLLALSVEFGICTSTARFIIKRQTWKHVGGPEFRPPSGRNGYTRLTESDVIAIRSASAKGARRKDLAHQYGIASAHVSAIVLRKSWRHVP